MGVFHVEDEQQTRFVTSVRLSRSGRWTGLIAMMVKQENRTQIKVGKIIKITPLAGFKTREAALRTANSIAEQWARAARLKGIVQSHQERPHLSLTNRKFL